MMIQRRNSPSKVPVGDNVVQVKFEDRPDGVGHVGGIALLDEPVGVGDNGSGAKSGSVPLRATPPAGERRQVNVELGLS